MQSHRDKHDYPTANDPSIASTLSTGGNAGTAVSTLEPYIPPNVPHGLPHVVNFATLSSMDLPLEVRFLILILARFAKVDGVTSVAVSTLCEICRIGSKNTVERWIGLAADVGIMRKEPGRGGKDRISNSYTFLGAARNWAPLPVGRPDTNPIVALAQARRLIEEIQPKAARVDKLEAELNLLRAEVALLRNGNAKGHPEVTNGDGEPPAATPNDSYETPVPDVSRGTHGAIGHSEVTNGQSESNPVEASHSYETPDSGSPEGNHGAIGHSEVTNGQSESSPVEASHSYETPDSGSPEGNHGAIGHSEVTNGSTDNPPEVASQSYETPDSGRSQGTHEAIGHSEVTNGPEQADEGQEYLSRRSRVETLVMKHRTFYQQSFNRRGVLGAIEYFSRSVENEQDLIRQTGILEAGGDPRETGTGPPPGSAAPPQAQVDPDRYAVGDCPDCGRPFATHGGATHCTDCTERRRRESEA